MQMSLKLPEIMTINYTNTQQCSSTFYRQFTFYVICQWINKSKFWTLQVFAVFTPAFEKSIDCQVCLPLATAKIAYIIGVCVQQADSIAESHQSRYAPVLCSVGQFLSANAQHNSHTNTHPRTLSSSCKKFIRLSQQIKSTTAERFPITNASTLCITPPTADVVH